MLDYGVLSGSALCGLVFLRGTLSLGFWPWVSSFMY